MESRPPIPPPVALVPGHDPRLAQLQRWLAHELAGRAFSLSPASADASFRRYFRVHSEDGASLIAMDAPPPQEDCRPWLKVARLFAQAGVHVPAIHAEDPEQGFLLLSDLGSTTYLQALNPGNADSLYADALGALIALQAATRPGALPTYDRALLRRELQLFPDWYVARHKGHTLAPAEQTALETVFDAILEVNLAEPQVFVHRDFHSRNLMLASPNPGVIDFQDAVCGPLSYDLVSLFKDAYIQWEEERVLDWLARYWETARALGLPVRPDFSDFHRDFEFMGVQRHLKVLGIFARLWYRDGKAAYLDDMPKVFAMLYRASRRWRSLAPLARLLDQLEPQSKVDGLTF